MQRNLVLLAASALTAGAALLGVTAAPASAATNTITVGTTVDAGNNIVLTSIREAFAEAEDDGEPTTVVLAAGATYLLDDCTGTGGDLESFTAQALTIDGNGATIEQTCAGQRVIDVNAPQFTIEDVTITGGDTTEAGAGVNANGPVTITDARFIDNHSVTNDSGGGGLRAWMGATITGSEFRDNSAHRGGAISSVGHTYLTDTAVVGNTGWLSGGIESSGTPSSLTVTNSTVSGNEATNHVAGGIFAINLTLRHATVSANEGVGGQATQIKTLGNLTSSRSAVVDSGAGIADCVITGTTTSNGYSLDSDGTCGFGAGTGDGSNAGEGQVLAYAANGGATPTALPTAGSDVLDMIPTGSCDGALPTDQRGTTRPQGDGCDIGAVEVVAVPVLCAGQVVDVDLADGDVPTAGPDVIRGTAGPDTVNALGGDDLFCGLGGVDTFTGGPGADRAFGGQGADVLRGSAGDDVLDGAGGNDRIYGQIGQDTLKGASGLDTIEGGTGNDVLNGGPQRDTCKGQAGQDTGTACEVRSSLP